MRRDKGISVNDRGRVVIDDIPDDERRRSSSKKKSDVKKKMQVLEEDSKEALRKKSVKKKGYEKDEPEVKKKKKRKKKTAGELIESGKSDKVMKRLAKFEQKALSVIGKIQGGDATEGLLPSVSINSESEFLDEYGRIYTNLQTIMRKIEASMLNPEKEFVSSKDVYALSTLYSQMRETISDMRSIKDMQAQADSLSLYILEPLKSSTGEAIISFYFKVMQHIRHHVNDERTIEAIKNSVDLAASETGNTLKNDFTVASAKIIDVLNGNR